ncbi:MAG: hypothetical protein LBT49_03925, partial [Prevotellaceae bacterium]|nr:hypothetical protein [Prevotellaceae bacterium]
WERPADKKVWSDTVWVFADYNNAGTMTRLPLAPGAKLSNFSWSGAKVIEEPGNNRGVWVVGNARSAGAFSATVQLVTTCGDARPCVPTGMCVYAINYPPAARYTDVDKIHFTGTPPFYVAYKEGGTTVVQNRYAKPFTVPAGKTVASFYDASLAPGTIICKPPVVQTIKTSAESYCAGSGVTLSLSGTESGAVYQLYKDNTPQPGITLTGNGSEMPFTGTFGKGTYRVSVVAGVFCSKQMSGALVVKDEYPLPGNPSVTGAGARCGTGTVPLSASSPGAEIDWYDVPNGGTVLSGGSAFTTPNVTATKTFYAEARNAATGCKSASRTGVTATVVATPAMPAISKSTRTVCAGNKLTFTASGGSGNYEWSGDVSGATGSQVNAKATGAGNYTATVLSVVSQQGITCKSGKASTTGTITAIGTDGTPSSPCGCVPGTVDCSGTCKTERTYTQNTTDCATLCYTAYVALYNQCGTLVNAQYSTYAFANNKCMYRCSVQARPGKKWKDADADCKKDGMQLPQWPMLAGSMATYPSNPSLTYWTTDKTVKYNCAKGHCKKEKAYSEDKSDYYCVYL